MFQIREQLTRKRGLGILPVRSAEIIKRAFDGEVCQKLSLFEREEG